MMMLRGSSNAGISSSRSSLFTAKQWQELEEQVIICKYMVSGLPIPSQLIYAVKTSFDSSLFPHRPVGWWPGCFQVGRKVDPEPGRCRRSDGKKWRCSKEVIPDSKYCDRHMHRGRNRSIKLTTHRNLNTVVGGPIAVSSDRHHNPFIHSQSTTPAAGSLQNDLFLNSGADKNHRLLDEREFFPESSRNLLQPLTMSSYKGCSSEFQGYNNNNSMQHEEQHFRSATTTSTTRRLMKVEKEDDPTQKQLHYFFGVCPPNNTAATEDSWLDLSSTNSRDT